MVKKSGDVHLVSERRWTSPSRPFQWRSRRRVSLLRTWERTEGKRDDGRDSKLRLRAVAIKGTQRELTWLGQPRKCSVPFAFPHSLLSFLTLQSSFCPLHGRRYSVSRHGLSRVSPQIFLSASFPPSPAPPSFGCVRCCAR